MSAVDHLYLRGWLSRWKKRQLQLQDTQWNGSAAQRTHVMALKLAQHHTKQTETLFRTVKMTILKMTVSPGSGAWTRAVFGRGGGGRVTHMGSHHNQHPQPQLNATGSWPNSFGCPGQSQCGSGLRYPSLHHKMMGMPTRSRLELGPSWVLVLRNAWEITVEERPLALEMCLHGYGGSPETRLKNGSFSPQNGPPRGTTAWYTPY